MDPESQLLKATIDQLFPIDTSTFDLIYSRCKIQKIKKGRIILQPSEIDNHYRFLIHGLVKSYSQINHKESINWIVQEGHIASSVVSIFKNLPSTEYLETIEDTTFLVIESEVLNKLIVENPIICLLINKWMMEYLVQYDRRMEMYRNPKPEKRLELFMSQQPQLLNRLSKIEIASYLNIAPGTLSAAFHKI